MKLKYKIIIIAITIIALSVWMISEGILSNNPAMMCYKAFNCVPSDASFLSCIDSDVQDTTTSIIKYCADPELVEVTEGSSVKIKMPDGTMIIVGS